MIRGPRGYIPWSAMDQEILQNMLQQNEWELDKTREGFAQDNLKVSWTLRWRR